MLPVVPEGLVSLSDVAWSDGFGNELVWSPVSGSSVGVRCGASRRWDQEQRQQMLT